jgi:hypothetical protein
MRAGWLLKWSYFVIRAMKYRFLWLWTDSLVVSFNEDNYVLHDFDGTS